jgi:hypothetical protein
MNRTPFIQGPFGVVLSAQGVSPGPASGISYTVRYNDSYGVIPGEYVIKPYVAWTFTDVVAHPQGFRFPISIAGTEIIPFMPHERPHVTECGA